LKIDETSECRRQYGRALIFLAEMAGQQSLALGGTIGEDRV
jgi:hypothetical protein